MLPNTTQSIHQSIMPLMPMIVSGIVTKVNTNLGTVNVDDPNTGEQFLDVPVSNGIGSSSEEGFVALPQEHDTVVVAFLNNSKFTPVVIGRIYNNGNSMPLTAKDEHVYKHRSGTIIKIDANGIVTINSKKVVLHGDTTVGHKHSYTDDGIPMETGTATDSIVGSGE